MALNSMLESRCTVFMYFLNFGWKGEILGFQRGVESLEEYKVEA